MTQHLEEPTPRPGADGNGHRITRILAIAPGADASGVVCFDRENFRVVKAWPDMPNEELLAFLRRNHRMDAIACEGAEVEYAHVGRETIRTIRFTGRIEEAAEAGGFPALMLPAAEVRLRVCGKEGVRLSMTRRGRLDRREPMRRELIDLLGPPGNRKDPGATYRVSGPAWRALAAAYVAALDLPDLSDSSPPPLP